MDESRVAYGDEASWFAFELEFEGRVVGFGRVFARTASAALHAAKIFTAGHTLVRIVADVEPALATRQRSTRLNREVAG